VSALEVSRVTKRFGGLVANQEVSFSVAPGELVGVIGPNGAGKSTLFDVITGFLSPDSGEIRFDGRPITRLRPDQVSRLGVGRTFQKLRPFSKMRVIENVMVGAFQKTHDPEEARETARGVLGRVGLLEKAETHAGTLSTGQRKRLELARALATGPRLLLLDEVTGGVDQGSIPGLIVLVRELHDSGMALAVIEHNMRVIMAIAQRVVALHLGQVIADGPPEAVMRDRQVIEAYLGKSYAS
jgi:branched-chain amino acid transport system ATP-binding protein